MSWYRDRSAHPVQEFAAFTADLYRLADGVWGVLEEWGLEVMLVDPRRTKNVPGRKTDVADCRWLQQLHTYGLLSGPSDRRMRSADRHHLLTDFTDMTIMVHYVSPHPLWLDSSNDQ